jgi:hypothetical protein
MATRKNLNNKFMRRLLTFVLAFAIVTTSTVVSPLGTLVAQAAEYTSGSQTLSLNNGMTVLTVGTDSYQLTSKYVTEDAGFYVSENSPIVVMLWKGNTLFGYCYDLQKSSSERILLDSGVISLLSTGEGSSRVITGYTTSSGVKSLPTLSEFKAKINGSNTSTSNSNTSSGSNTTTNNGSTSNNDSTSSTTTSTTLNCSASLDGTTAYLNVFENGYYSKNKITSSSNLQSVGYDSLGSIYLYYGKTLKVWNYQIQKAETTKQLITVSTNCTGLAYKSANSNEVAGYYENGELKSLWTLDQIKASTSTVSTYKKWSRVVYKGATRYVQDSNKKTVCTAKLKNNKVYYRGKLIATGKTSNKIKSVGFTSKSKHFVIFRTAKHGCYIYNRTAGTWKKWRSDVTAFHYNANGFIDKVKLTSGSYVKITNTY